MKAIKQMSSRFTALEKSVKEMVEGVTIDPIKHMNMMLYPVGYTHTSLYRAYLHIEVPTICYTVVHNL